MSDYLNPQTPLSEYLQSRRAALKQEIIALKKLPADQQAFELELKARFWLEPLALGTPQVSQQVKKTVEERRGAQRVETEVREVEVILPYRGEKVLWNCKPATYEPVEMPHRHKLFIGLFKVYLWLKTLSKTDYEQALGEFIAAISVNMERINNQLSFYNEEIADIIRTQLILKRQELFAERHFMEEVGLKVNPVSDEYLIPSPIALKKVPAPVAETGRRPGLPLATLQLAVYQDIREVIYNVGRAMERKPSLYLGKWEEDLRDVFLLFLETRYESTTGAGEAFNKKGKTDILLRYAADGSNLFVAECKFWKGPRQFTAAIDQLLSYLTCRDAKTALMIFVRQQDFTAVIHKVKLFAAQHPQFRRFVQETYDTSFAFEMRLPGDPGSLIAMEFMLFHFPDQELNPDAE